MAENPRNLWLRIASALLLLPVVLFLVAQGGGWFVALVAVAAGACAYELTTLTWEEGAPWLKWVSVLFAALTPLVFFFSSTEQLGLLGVAFAPGAAVLFLTLHLLAPGPSLEAVPRRVAVSTLALLWCGAPFGLLVRLREIPGEGLWWVVMVMALTWMNDTGAYAAGMTLGRHKLYPRISPGKSWEGFVGGMLAGFGGALAVSWVSGQLEAEGLRQLELGLWPAAALAFATGIFGPMGDLSASLLKRAVGAKDTGNLIPGHGGVLDRVDALLFNAVVVYLFAALALGAPL